MWCTPNTALIHLLLDADRSFAARVSTEPFHGFTCSARPISTRSRSGGAQLRTLSGLARGALRSRAASAGPALGQRHRFSAITTPAFGRERCRPRCRRTIVFSAMNANVLAARSSALTTNALRLPRSGRRIVLRRSAHPFPLCRIHLTKWTPCTHENASRQRHGEVLLH